MPDDKPEGKPDREWGAEPSRSESPLDVDETSPGSVGRQAGGTNFAVPLLW